MHRATWLVVLFLFSCLAAFAEPIQTHVVCRESLNASRRENLEKALREITGWSELRFDRSGMLRLGSMASVGGSSTARALLEQSTFGHNFIVIEDASGRAEVAFSQVVDGKWKSESVSGPPAFVIQIDFSDFDHVLGDRRALKAFNAGWALLHELDHVINNSHDSNHLGAAGACESHINQMRSECGLPKRAEYFFTYLPLTDDSNTRLVRLPFETNDGPNKRKRYWLLWNAQLVGGIEKPRTVAMK